MDMHLGMHLVICAEQVGAPVKYTLTNDRRLNWDNLLFGMGGNNIKTLYTNMQQYIWFFGICWDLPFLIVV